MFSQPTYKNRNDAGEKHRDHHGERYVVAIRVDSMNWRMFIVGGAIACVVALQSTVQIFEPSTIRSVVFVGGMCAIVGGLGLRRHFHNYIERKVRGIIAPYM